MPNKERTVSFDVIEYGATFMPQLRCEVPDMKHFLSTNWDRLFKNWGNYTRGEKAEGKLKFLYFGELPTRFEANS